MRAALAAAIALLTLAVPALASNKPVPGKLTLGTLAEFDELGKYVSGRNVTCAWRGPHVIVKLVVINSSVESIKVTIKPRYYIARGSEHGSGFLSTKDFTIRGGKQRAITIDAGAPEGTPRGAQIGRCAPYVYLVDHG